MSTGKIPTADLKKLEDQIGVMIRHENELLNHRIQWFLTLNGFLFTAVAIYGNQPGRNWFGTALALLGLLTCFSFGIALRVGGSGFQRLKELWDGYHERRDDDFHTVGVVGYLASTFQNTFAPWRALPVMMAVGWAAVTIFVWSFPGHSPPGSFVPVVLEDSEIQLCADKVAAKRLQVYDSRTGEPKR